MQRQALESTAVNYPYLQGLWTIPFGFGMFVSGLSNLQDGPSAPVTITLVVGLILLSGASMLFISRYYKKNYGTVTPARRSQVRCGVAIAAFVLVLFVGANRMLFWSPDSSICVYAAAFAVAILAYYAILVGVRAHHIAVWGALFIAGLLPIWGGLGADRDALAMFPMGIALIVSGLLDQRLLARSFATVSSNLKQSDA